MVIIDHVMTIYHSLSALLHLPCHVDRVTRTRLEEKVPNKHKFYFKVTFFGVVFADGRRPADDVAPAAAVAPVTGLARPRLNMTLLRVITAENSRSGNSLHNDIQPPVTINIFHSGTF